MARQRLATCLYGLALLLLPMTAALKQMLQLTSTVWIDPSMVLSLSIWMLLGFPRRDKYIVLIAGVALLSALLGSHFLGPSRERDHSAFYAFYAEPIRLSLDAIWYLVSLEFLLFRREFVVRWLSISVLVQFAMAAYLYLGMFDLVSVPNPINIYLEIYKQRQVAELFNLQVVRMAGTFIEAPPFGLFMLCSFIIFSLYFTCESGPLWHRLRYLSGLAAACSLCGALASLSDATLLGVLVFGAVFYLSFRKSLLQHKHGKVIEAVVMLALLAGVGSYTAGRVSAKVKEAMSPTPVNNDVLGEPGAERMFHVRYALGLFEEVPLAILTGIGPGRYGDYVARTGVFPPTTQIGFTPVFWLVEYGCIGASLIIAWLVNVGKRGSHFYGALALGAIVSLILVNISQAGWMFETWFLALGFLYTSKQACSWSLARHQTTGVR